MPNYLENFLNKIVKYGLYAILLTPLTFWLKALYPFLTPKFILFQILVEIVFGAWLILLIYRGGFTRIIADLRRNYIALALFGFFAVSFLSAVFGVDFSRSFWGIGPRMTGLFAELHFFAWFLMLATAFSNTNRDSRHSYAFVNSYYYINFSFFVSLIVAATAFYQNSSWSLAIGSTIFNNPTFVAPYFIFHFFWGLYQTLSSKFQVPSFKRWIFAAGSALLFISIILTQIRGAILGFLAGLFIFGIILFFSGILSRRAKIAIAALYLILIAGIAGFWSIRDLPAVQNISFLNKISQTSLTGTTVQTRLLDWQEAIAGFKDRPLLGIGPENYNFVFNAHYNPEFVRFADDFAETWSDKPHNAFLEILTETGIIGSLAYLLILVAVAWTLLKLWRKGEKILAGAILGGFLGYLGSIFFAFDSFGSWFGLFLMLGFLVSHNSNTNDTNKHTNDANGNFLKNIFVLFVCGVLFVLLYVNYGIWRANIYDAEALRTFNKNPEAGLPLFQKSFSYWTPYKAEYQFDFAASVIGAVQKNIPLPDLENTLNSALEEMDKAIAAHPYNAAYYSDAAKLYNILGEKGKDPAILNQAEQFGEKALELSPNRQETLFYLAQNSLLKKDIGAAIKWTKVAIDAYPQWKKGYWYLGRIYFVAGRRQEAAVEIKKALELGYLFQNPSEVQFARDLLGDEFMRRIGY